VPGEHRHAVLDRLKLLADRSRLEHLHLDRAEVGAVGEHRRDALGEVARHDRVRIEADGDCRRDLLEGAGHQLGRVRLSHA
jgi:hypothetical protein